MTGFNLRDSLRLCFNDCGFPNQLHTLPSNRFPAISRTAALCTGQCGFVFRFSFLFVSSAARKPVGVRHWRLSFISRSGDNRRVYHKFPRAHYPSFNVIFFTHKITNITLSPIIVLCIIVDISFCR